MKTMVVTSKVDADGTLNLRLPLGKPEAGRDVRITVKTMPNREPDQAEYISWLHRISGQWQGDFERMPQGEFEQRDPM